MIGGKERLCNCCGQAYRYSRRAAMERCRTCRNHPAACSAVNPVSVLQWTGDTIRYFHNPCTYIYQRKDGSALYVGCGRHGLSRVLDHRSERDKTEACRRQARAECYSVRVQFYSSYNEARTAETVLIRTLRPTYNNSLAKYRGQRNSRTPSIQPQPYQICTEVVANVSLATI